MRPEALRLVQFLHYGLVGGTETALVRRVVVVRLLDILGGDVEGVKREEVVGYVVLVLRISRHVYLRVFRGL